MKHMHSKVFVLDTSVLLYDPDSIRRFHGPHTVVIPMAVLEELDAMKRLSDEVGKNARQVLRYIDVLQRTNPLALVTDGVEIASGIRLKIYLEQKLKPELLNNGEKGMSKILLAALSLMRLEQEKKVILVSKSFITRVRASVMGIEAEDYETLKSSYEHLYRGLRRVELPKSDIDLFYKNGYLSADQSFFEKFSAKDPKNSFFPNEYCLLSCPEHSSVVCKYNRVSKQLEPLKKLIKDIWGIKPLNVEQKCAFDLLLRPDIPLVTLLGSAGTGKTLLALAVGLQKVFDEESYNKILVSRPVIPLGRDIGYLPGTKEEKLYHWMQAIYDNLEVLCRALAHDKGADLQQSILDSRKFELEAVTYIRGRSLPGMYIIIDEAQNLTPHEIKSIISRAGKGTKVVLTGDPTQIDHPYLDKDSNALTYIVWKMHSYPGYGHVCLEKTERSELAAAAAELL